MFEKTFSFEVEEELIVEDMLDEFRSQLKTVDIKWVSKYNSYVVYNYKPFCSDGFNVEVTVVGDKPVVNYMEYLIKKRRDNIALLTRSVH